MKESQSKKTRSNELKYSAIADRFTTIVERYRESIYKANEALLTKLQRQQLDNLRKKVAAEGGTYFEFYSAAKKYCNKYEDMMRSHGIKRKE